MINANKEFIYKDYIICNLLMSSSTKPLREIAQQLAETFNALSIYQVGQIIFLRNNDG
jgi:hypothetical protein